MRKGPTGTWISLWVEYGKHHLPIMQQCNVAETGISLALPKNKEDTKVLHCKEFGYNKFERTQHLQDNHSKGHHGGHLYTPCYCASEGFLKVKRNVNFKLLRSQSEWTDWLVPTSLTWSQLEILKAIVS